MYLLLLIMFTGDMQTEVYHSSEECEVALVQKTDQGYYKKIKIAKCVSLEEELK